MPYTQHRLTPWHEVVGADAEKIFAYGGCISEQIRNNNHAAGSVLLQGTPVPAGKIYVITVSSGMDFTLGCTSLSLTAVVQGVVINLFAQGTPNAGIAYTWSGQLCLSPGSYMTAYFTGTGANDDLYLRYAGYSMRVP